MPRTNPFNLRWSPENNVYILALRLAGLIDGLKDYHPAEYGEAGEKIQRVLDIAEGVALKIGKPDGGKQ